MKIPFALQAEQSGLPPPPVKGDHSGTKMKMSQSVLDTLQAEEASGMAKTETDIDNSLGEEERRQLSERMKEHMVCSIFVSKLKLLF